MNVNISNRRAGLRGQDVRDHVPYDLSSSGYARDTLNPDYARGADFGGDTGATVWYKRSVHNVLATTETPA